DHQPALVDHVIQSDGCVQAVDGDGAGEHPPAAAAGGPGVLLHLTALAPGPDQRAAVCGQVHRRQVRLEHAVAQDRWVVTPMGGVAPGVLVDADVHRGSGELDQPGLFEGEQLAHPLHGRARGPGGEGVAQVSVDVSAHAVRGVSTQVDQTVDL